MDWFKKNWKYLAVIAAAALIVAVVLIVALPGSNNEGPVADVPVAEGPETGVYYYDTAEGEYVLMLNSGNSFTIAGPSLNKTGKYVVTENGIELDANAPLTREAAADALYQVSQIAPDAPGMVVMA